MGVSVEDGEEADREGSGVVDLSVPPPTPAEPIPPFRLDGLLLLDARGADPVAIDGVIFADDGIGVVRNQGEPPRVLPWSSVVSHVVEPWRGGVVPEWWVDPELHRADPPPGPAGPVVDPRATNRALPHIEAGVLIGIQTPVGTYRFLYPGGSAATVAPPIAAFALRHQGPAGASSVTRVVAWGQDIERRRVPRRPPRSVSWSTVQPFLVVLLILFLATAATLILLQSAGTIHLPYLGGAGSGSVGPLRRR
jgi:hypothetical protein